MIPRSASLTAPSAPSSTTSISQNLEICLRKNPACIHIMGVLSTFQEPPSILQIARVLNWPSEKVFEVLRPVLWHIGPIPDHFSDLTLDEPLITWLFEPAKSGPLCRNKAECNYVIARWCLADNANCDVRDIEYTTRYWLYHITQSIPSHELCGMILTSRFVLAPSWSKKLDAIEIWLRKYSEGDEVKYLNMFRASIELTILS
ncbi:hypothetical protein C8R45DRAFT_1224640 [Mycena sanguinolenta]|nr:hypothetical protein C8R45DRAFT_1224640 [Mycena sanguinolenta]